VPQPVQVQAQAVYGVVLFDAHGAQALDQGQAPDPLGAGPGVPAGDGAAHGVTDQVHRPLAQATHQGVEVRHVVGEVVEAAGTHALAAPEAALVEGHDAAPGQPGCDLGEGQTLVQVAVQADDGGALCLVGGQAQLPDPQVQLSGLQGPGVPLGDGGAHLPMTRAMPARPRSTASASGPKEKRTWWW